MKIRPVVAELFHADGRTDRQTYSQTSITKLTVAFRNFENAPKSENLLQQHTMTQPHNQLSYYLLIILV
jgi:hypothetical protein